MSSAINHRKRSHRSHNKQYAAAKKMRIAATGRDSFKNTMFPFWRILSRFRNREKRSDSMREEASFDE